MVSEPLPKIDRFGTPHASVNYPEELDDNASLTIRSVGLVIHVHMHMHMSHVHVHLHVLDPRTCPRAP